MRFILALIVGKILSTIGRINGKGTNLPGDLALKVDPKLLAKFRFKGKVIAVTGSNGKTTTTNILTFILNQAGHTVISNQKGSNLTGGVSTTLINHADFKGNVDADFVVLEVDERFSRLIFKDFAPDYLICTNLFRDQLTRNGNIDVIINKLEEAIAPTVKLILNANDPISADLAINNKRIYYGLANTEYSAKDAINITHDAKVCPRCYHRLSYEYFHYNHIGKFHCDNCGYQTPLAKYLAKDVDLMNGDFKINEQACSTDFKSIFNILNVTAAVATVCELGLDIKSACQIAGRFTIMEQRYKEFFIGDRKALMILSKNQNPVSYDQSIAYLLNMNEQKSAIIVVNNINHTFHKDTTWLYDISFEKLNDQLDSVVCTGERAYDLAFRLKLAGFDETKLLIEPKINNIKPLIAMTKGTICFLSELYDAKAVIEAVK